MSFALINCVDCTPAEKNIIAALDVGTTTLRCQIVNGNGDCLSYYSMPTKLMHPMIGYAEIPHEQLWIDSQHVIKNAISGAHLTANDISTLGISTQRATFITWHRDTGEPFHNFITWKDIRCADLVSKWNRSLLFKCFTYICYVLFLCTRNPLFRIASTLKFTSAHVSMRLLWVLENIPELRKDISKVMFGTLDTWLLYKLTSGAVYKTDFASASSTGLVDPFEMNWSKILHTLLGLPRSIYPPIVANDADLGYVDKRHFGARIAIGCSMPDQQASMIGSCCYDRETLKITLGTGAFLNVVTKKVHPGGSGIYPIVYINLNGKFAYMVEGSCHDSGSLITWALNSGLCETPSETAIMASSVDGNDGVYFIPAFGGLGPPICDERAATGFIGIKPTTRKEHMMRAILESIVFQIMLQYCNLRGTVKNNIKTIFVDGGVSQNNFICQSIADMTNIQVERTESSEMSVLGAAYIAGLNKGIWKSRQDFINMRKIERIFHPNPDVRHRINIFHEFERWQKVLCRFKSWYTEK